MYLATVFFLAVGGFNSQNNLLFWAFGVGVAGLLISGIVSGAPLMRLELARSRVEPVSVAEQIRIGYGLRNRGRLWPAYAIRIDEIPSTSETAPWMYRCPAVIAHIGPRQITEVRTDAKALRRGIHELSRVRVSSTFPFGLIRKSLYFDLPQTITVRPRIVALQHAVRARIVPGHAHSPRSYNRAGRGEEFFALRDYVAGDPMRTISWRASAKRNDLVVQQQAALAPPRLWIRLDAPPSNIPELEYENTIALVASVLAQAGRDHLSPGLQIAWADVSLAPAGGPAGLERALDTLARLESGAQNPGNADGTPPDVTITFSPTSADGGLCGSDTATWATEPFDSIIEPTPAGKPRRSKRLQTKASLPQREALP